MVTSKKQNNYNFKIGDILKVVSWCSCDSLPRRIFRVVDIDDIARIWYNEKGIDNCIGLAYVKYANIFEKLWYVFIKFLKK